MYRKRLPYGSYNYIAWRADQALQRSYPLDIYCDDVGLCVFVQEHALVDEARAKDHSKSI